MSALKKGSIRPEDKAIGGRLKIIRKRMGIKPKELALSMGLSRQQIQKYENGDNRVPASRLFEFSKTYNVPINLFDTPENKYHHEYCRDLWDILTDDRDMVAVWQELPPDNTKLNFYLVVCAMANRLMAYKKGTDDINDSEMWDILTYRKNIDQLWEDLPKDGTRLGLYVAMVAEIKRRKNEGIMTF